MKSRNRQPQAPRTVTLSFCVSREDAELIRRAGNRAKSRSSLLYGLLDQRKLSRLRAQLAPDTTRPR